MKKYLCIRDCYFRQLWHKGDIAEFEDTVTVPEHFKAYKNEVERLAERIAEDKIKQFMQEQAKEGSVTDGDAAERLEDMTITKLRSYAKSYGIEVEKGATKEEIIAAIRGE